MTRCMVFDTETTGLPDKVNKVENHNLHLWPHIVQLSYIIYDNETNVVIKQKNVIIKVPNNINIPDNVVLIHGITNDISKNNGSDIIKHLIEFMEDYNNIDILIGHNISFDVNLIRAELLRHVLYNDFEKLKDTTKHYCTMQNTKKMCNMQIINKQGYKYIKPPKLIELHTFLFNKEPKHLHNALNDVLICFRCYYMVNFNEDICSKNDTIKNLIYTLF